MTLLKLARELRSAFPQILDVKIERLERGRVRIYCLTNPETPEIVVNDVLMWANKHAWGDFEAKSVSDFPMDLVDEEELLRRAGVPRVVVEETLTSTQGTTRGLRTLFPDDVVGIGGVGENLVVHVVPDLDPSREQTILSALRLLLVGDFGSNKISREAAPTEDRAASPPIHAESAVARRLLAKDTSLLLEHLKGTISGESIPLSPLPSGSSTFASVHDGIRSLIQRVALFDRVYVHVPFHSDEFPQWAGASFEEFVAALPTGRIVPVFANSPDRYEPGLISKIVDAGAPRLIFNGEIALRAIGSLARAHPLVPMVQNDPAGAREFRAALTQNDDSRLGVALGYVDAITSVADDLPGLILSAPTWSFAWQPIADWLAAELAKRFEIAQVGLELGVAIDHQLKTDAIGGRPMSQVGHYLDGHLMFVYGAKPGESDLLRVPDPEMIGRIAFPDTKGLSLREFAENFKGPVVEAMHALMSSERVQTASETEDLVRKFTEELHQYRPFGDDTYAAIGVLLTVLGTIGGFGVPTAVATLTLELARRVLGRKAPGVLAQIEAKTARTTPEAALLARIKASR